MSFLKKLCKWLLILVIVVAVVGFFFTWQMLGVNVFEGDQAHLWEVVSNDVNFFARAPGTKALRGPLADALKDEPGYEIIGDLQLQLAEATRTVARQANPDMPFGMKVDFERDFLGNEFAVAGQMGANIAEMKIDRFIGLTRIAWYARFVSALQADFVRSRIPDASRIELVSGYYFKFTLTAEEAEGINAIRSSPLPDNELYFGRIKDVFLVSDTPEWIEAAIRGGNKTLPADPWFETTFIKNGNRSDKDVELFMRPALSSALLATHGRKEYGGPLQYVSSFLPINMAGEVTVRATLEDQGVALDFFDNPPTDGFTRIRQFAPHLQSIYEREKTNLKAELTEDGIARYIPSRRTVGALVFEGAPKDIIGLLTAFLPRDGLELYDEEIRRTPSKVSNRRYNGLEQLLEELLEDFGDTHMLVIHRPQVFENESYSTYEPADFDFPPPQFMYALVSRIKDNAIGDRIRQKFQDHLPQLQLVDDGVHESGKFHLAKPTIEDAEETKLIRPAYGPMVGGAKYFVFASHPEIALSIWEAAENERERLVNEVSVSEAIAKLPSTGAVTNGTLAMVLRGDVLRDGLFDLVRERARIDFNIPAKMSEWRRRYDTSKMSEEEIENALLADKERHISQHYGAFADRYRDQLRPLAALDTFVMAAALGVGPERKVRADAYLRFRVEPADEPSGE